MKVKKMALDVLGFVTGSGPYPDVSEADIAENMLLLQRTDWFQALLEDEKTRQLFIYDPDLRYDIGAFNTERLEKNLHRTTYQRKIEKRVAEKQKYVV